MEPKEMALVSVLMAGVGSTVDPSALALPLPCAMDMVAVAMVFTALVRLTTLV
jgi:hypothetical protein